VRAERPPQQVRQLGDVDRDPPRLIARQPAHGHPGVRPICLVKLGTDGERARQIDDGEQRASQHPIWSKPVNNGDHAGRYGSNDEHVKLHRGSLIRASRQAAGQARQPVLPLPPLASEFGVDALGLLAGGEGSRALAVLGVPAAGFGSRDGFHHRLVCRGYPQSSFLNS
jgi:hypothetical protein